jgi:hypothetical protein
MIFNSHNYRMLSTLFDPRLGYAGYKPNVRELPNGDGKIDAEKRYLHVAPKYNPPAWAVKFLARAHYEACRVAEALGVPDSFYPRVADGTLRVLEYPAGAGSEQHKDFDLFTILCYRETPEDLVRTPPLLASADDAERLDAGERMSPGLHLGELGELAGVGPATPHYVPARDYIQRSIVYFAMPSHAAELPDPVTFPATDTRPLVTVHTVGQWVKERVVRSRAYA